MSRDDLIARWPDAERIVDGLLDLPSAARRRRAVDACGPDAELRRVVERLLDEADRDAPLNAAAIEVADHAADALRPQVGPYRVLGQLGRGGMGWVLRVVRDGSPAPPVALKLLDIRTPSREALIRFDRERDTLARLQHPNIARLLDGGVADDGTPYLVMELVDGRPIDAVDAADRRDIHSCLRLFLQVAAAVEYAHGQLVVHRDIKPANVLVDHFGQTKLLDFGIAKWLDDLEGEGVTATAHRVLTPSNAAPEQFRGERVTVATDVYQLGLLLYELLTGRRANGPRDSSPEALRRATLESDPEAPSRVAAIGPATFAHDLDAIVMKAIRKEPTERYPSVEAMRRDIEALLAHQPVSARRGNQLYVLRKYVRRHRAGFGVAAGIVLALLTGLIGVASQSRATAVERDLAQARLADVRRLANTLIFDVYDQVENSPNATPIRRALVEKGVTYLDHFTVEAQSDPVLSMELAEAYRRLATVQGAHGQANLGDREGALSSLEKGRSFLRPMLSRANVPLEIEIADQRLLREMVTLVVNEPERARRLAAEGVERATRLRDQFPNRSEPIEMSAHAHFLAAVVAPADKEIESWSEANATYIQLVERMPDDADHLRNLARTEKYIGTIHGKAGRWELARASFQRAIDLDRRVQKLRPTSRQTSLDLAIDLGNLARMLLDSQPPALKDAIDLYRESLALRERAVIDDPQDVRAREGLGFCLTALSTLTLRQGDVDQALEYGRRAVDAYESLAPSENVARRGSAWEMFGWATLRAGRSKEGCAALRRASALYHKASLGPPGERQALRPAAASSLEKTVATCPQ